MANSLYKWYKYNLNVICDKCKNPIAFQSVHGNPFCESCGTQSHATWTEAVEFSGIKKLKQYETGSTRLAGFMSIDMSYEMIESVPCFHCDTKLALPKDIKDSTHTCANCNQPIPFVPMSERDLFFYFHPNDKTNLQGTTIAVRCASCGAPCEADSAKYEFNCNSCNTLNIIPPSMRAKKVLDDVYIGWKQFK